MHVLTSYIHAHKHTTDTHAPPPGTIDLKLVMATKRRGKGDATITVKLVGAVQNMLQFVL